MTYRITSHDFAKDLVIDYAKYNQSDRVYKLSLKDIPEDEQFKLCSLLLEEDEDLLSETLSPDNHYFDDMSNGLMFYLSNTEKDFSRDEFIKEMKKGVRHYLQGRIEKLFKRYLSDLNDEKGCSWSDERKLRESGVSNNQFL